MGTPSASTSDRGKKLAIGTVQFGQAYGISNVKGQPGEREVSAILQYAAKNGVVTLDTAPAYGDAESVLGHVLEDGHPFRIITKTAALRDIAFGSSPGSIILETFEQSLSHLRVNRVEGLMVHLAEDLIGPNGDQVWAALDHIKVSGRAKTIGTSCYTSKELLSIIERYPIDLVQLPLNIFDQRLVQDGTLSRLKERGIEVHARSAFLQGLALMNPDHLPDNFTRAEHPLRAFSDAANDVGISQLELALGFVGSIDEVDRVVTGINDVQELSEVLAAIQCPLPKNVNTSALASDDEAVITPSMWPPDTQKKWGFDFSTDNDSDQT